MGKSVPGRIKLSVTCKPVIGIEADYLGRGTRDRICRHTCESLMPSPIRIIV